MAGIPLAVTIGAAQPAHEADAPTALRERLKPTVGRIAAQYPFNQFQKSADSVLSKGLPMDFGEALEVKHRETPRSCSNLAERNCQSFAQPRLSCAGSGRELEAS